MTTTYTFDESLYSDLHKDVYGFRPSAASFEFWNSMSDAKKQAEWDLLLERLSDELDQDRMDLADHMCEIDHMIMDTIEHGARDPQEAMRWLTQVFWEEISHFGISYWTYEMFGSCDFGLIQYAAKMMNRPDLAR